MSNFTVHPARPEPVGAAAPGPQLRLVSPVPTWIDVCDLETAATYRDAWAALQDHAFEPNAFMEPDFALTAVRHLVAGRRPDIVFVWGHGQAGAPVLIGVCLIEAQPRRGGKGAGVARVWSHNQATTSAPLLDEERAVEALDALLEWVARRPSTGAGLLVRGVEQQGALGRLMAERGGRRFAATARRTRAILTRDHDGPGAVSPKRAKELRRQLRRMADEGTVAFRAFTSPDDVRGATEQFLELESRGWKGRSGTALLHDPGRAAFVRSMTRLLARQGKCRVHSLEVDGTPVAMGVVLQSGDRSYFWKTAYDEGRASHSPGKQFSLLLTQAQLADGRVAMTDSCAVPDHPMIDRLWPERMIVADLLVGAPDTPPELFARALRRIVLADRCRSAAKALAGQGRRWLARMTAMARAR